MMTTLMSGVSTSASGEIREYGIYTKKEIADTRAKLKNGDPAAKEAFDQFIHRVDSWCMPRLCHAAENFYIKWYYVSTQEHITASKDLTHDAYAAFAAALAWQLTGEDKYAEKAKEFLNGWAEINTGGFSTEEDTPLVAASGGVGFIYAAELVTEYEGWSEKEQAAFKNWVATRYKPAVFTIVDNENNWADWAVLACLATSHYLNDTAVVDALIAKIPKLIDSQIDSEGRLPLEIKRGTNGMWYTYFCLAPLTQAAQFAYNLRGTNYFNYTAPSGGSIEKALDNFFGYVQDPDRWDADYKEEQYSGQRLNRPRPGNGAIAAPNWPLNLYKSMADIYGSRKRAFGEYAAEYEPMMGGWTEREAHHLAWCFPSLMPAPALVTK